MSQLYSGGISKVESGQPYMPEVSLSFANLEMLLNFYAPELKPEYAQLMALRDDMGSTLVDLVSGRVPSDRTKKQALNEKLIKASFKAEKVTEQLIKRASELGRKHLALKTEQNHASDALTSRC